MPPLQVYCKYQQYKRQQARYDNADLVAHVYRQLAEQGYQGVPIHNLYRYVPHFAGTLQTPSCMAWQSSAAQLLYDVSIASWTAA